MVKDVNTMNIIEKTTDYKIAVGTVTHHQCKNLDGVANTQYKPYSFQYWTATKNGKTSKRYHARGHAVNWLIRQK